MMLEKYGVNDVRKYGVNKNTDDMAKVLKVVLVQLREFSFRTETQFY